MLPKIEGFAPAFAIGLALALSSTAVAETPDPLQGCTDFRVRAEREIVAAKSCSDAYFVRDDVREGDAVCFLAMTAKDNAGDSLLALKADGKALDECMRSFRPLAQKYLETSQWLLDMSKFRSDRHANPTPKPLAVKMDDEGR